MLGRRQLLTNTVAIAVAASLTSGCGFRLAGDYDLGEFYPQVALKSKKKFREFTEPLQQAMEKAGIEVVSAKVSGVPLLNIEDFEFENDPTNANEVGIAESFNIVGRVRYELTFVGQKTSDYIKKDDDGVIKRSRSRTLSESRFIDANTEDDIEGSREAMRLQEEILDDLVQSMMRVLVFKRDKVNKYARL